MSAITETQTKALVVDDSPLMILVDGATVSCPAVVLDDAVYAVDARVTVTVRNPLVPLVLGVES